MIRQKMHKETWTYNKTQRDQGDTQEDIKRPKGGPKGHEKDTRTHMET